MEKSKDKMVAQIFESYEYDKFKVVSQNRGHIETNGVKHGKLNKLQKLIDQGRYVEEKGLIFVNEDFLIVEGRHTFELRKQNNMPIRYTFIKHEGFNNGTTRRQLVGNIYNINTINTAWTSSDFFHSAVQTKAPLALIIDGIVEKYDNTFKWSDIMGLLIKDESLFNGRFAHLELKIFDDKELIEEINSRAFKAELEYFVELNSKARVSFNRKGPILQAAYQVINKAAGVLDVGRFRKSILKIDDAVLNSTKMKNLRTSITAMVKHFDKTTGNTIEPSAVLQEIVSKQKSETATTSKFEEESIKAFSGKVARVQAAL